VIFVVNYVGSHLLVTVRKLSRI